MTNQTKYRVELQLSVQVNYEFTVSKSQAKRLLSEYLLEDYSFEEQVDDAFGTLAEEELLPRIQEMLEVHPGDRSIRAGDGGLVYLSNESGDIAVELEATDVEAL